jgi:aryl-alcohol dehydrogenase-like predicted oxidoreductase
MEQRQLGKQGPAISTIGFGCWAMGGDAWGPQDDQASIEAIRVALDNGITWFDTAPIYGKGHSEQVLGRGLGSRRTEVVLATKCGLVWDAQGKVSNNGQYDSILRECEASLRRLGTDYIDLYQMHWPDTGALAPAEETMRAMETLVQQGKVRYAGVSNYDVPLLQRSLSVRHVDSLQPPYNLFTRGVEAEVLPFCREHGIGVVAYSPLASGLLSGHYAAEAVFAAEDWRSRDSRFSGKGLQMRLALNQHLSEIAGRSQRSLAQLAIAWVLANPAVTAAIVGVRKPEHIIDALPAAGWHLDDATYNEIAALLTANPLENA